MADRKWREITVDTDGTVWDKQEPIEGEFVKVEHDIGPNKSNMYTLKTKDGEVKVWGSTVLDDKLMGIPQGAYVKIEYEGKKPSKNGGSYHSFKLFIDDAEPAKDKVAPMPNDEEIKISDIPF